MIDHDKIIKMNQDIEELVYQNDVSYIDAILTYCEDNTMEYEVVSAQLSGMIHEKVRKEAIELKMLKPEEKINELPL